MDIYGYTIEFKLNEGIRYWQNHWNHKVYDSKEHAEEAIVQMKKAYPFYDKSDFITVPLYHDKQVTIRQQQLSGYADKSAHPKSCPECGGRGDVGVWPFMVKCKQCDGTGHDFA